MSRRLDDRLRALELKNPSAADMQADAKARAKSRVWLDNWIAYLEQNHERGPNESWADVSARLWGFESTKALRQWLMSPRKEAG